jgi:hypothetical protein
MKKHGGLLDSLMDPDTVAMVADRSRLVGHLAEQMGVTRREAADALFHFEAVTTSAGQVLN